MGYMPNSGFFLYPITFFCEKMDKKWGLKSFFMTRKRNQSQNRNQSRIQIRGWNRNRIQFLPVPQPCFKDTHKRRDLPTLFSPLMLLKPTGQRSKDTAATWTSLARKKAVLGWFLFNRYFIKILRNSKCTAKILF